MTNDATTKELTIPLPDALDKEAKQVAMTARRLGRMSEEMPAGMVRESVKGVGLRLLAAADVLEARAKEVRKHWRGVTVGL